MSDFETPVAPSVLTEGPQSKETPTRESLLKASVVDLLSKAAALILACIYGFGFLVVSLDEAEYGILQINVLKSRIFAAGALFVLMLAIPTFSIRRVLRHSPIPQDAGRGWLKWSYDANRYFNMCIFLAFLSYGYLWGWGETNVRNFPEKFSTIRSITFALCLSLSASITLWLRRHYRTEPSRCRLLPLADFVVANIIVLYVMHPFVGVGRFVYWFFVVGLYAGWIDDRLRESKKRDKLYFEVLLIYILVLVTFYARFMYQNLNPSIGGGRPPAVTVYLREKISPFDQLQENLYLVDESESGFYFVRNPNERQAVFVPRSSVASIQFSDQSPRLRPNDGGASLPPTQKVIQPSAAGSPK